MAKYLIAICLPIIAAVLLAVGLPGRAAAFDPFRPTDPDTPQACSQTDASFNQSTVCTPDGSNPITGPGGIITKIANIFAFITGVAAVVLIIVGGFEYVRSGGDSSKINKSKNTILFAVIGLVVVALARSLVALAVSKL